MYQIKEIFRRYFLSNIFWRGRLISLPSLSFLAFFFIFLYFSVSLAIPFFMHNELNSVDVAGLYFSSWYQKEYLFPSVIGWNPFFFLAYTQNQFYPPLFSYLSAALSFIISLSIAFKILFLLSVYLLPTSFYFFARSYGFSRDKSAVSMSIMTLLLFLFPLEFFGGNLHATFHIGLVTHSLGMSLFFFYWGVLEKNYGKSKYVLLTILFSLIILTHIIAAFAVIFLTLSYLICKNKDRAAFIFLFKHIGLTFLLTAFWTVPFLLKSSWLNAYPIGLIISPYLFASFVLLYLLFLFVKRKERHFSIGYFMLIVLSFSFLATSFLFIPIHLYRFMMYLLVLIPFVLMSLFDRESYLVYAAILIAAILIMPITPNLSAVGPVKMPMDSLNFSDTNSRVFVLAPFSKESSPHMLQHQIPMQNEIYGLRGLYIESALNSRFIFDLEHEFEPDDSAVWGLYIDSTLIIQNKSYLFKNIIPRQFELFGISYAVATEKYFSDWKQLKYVGNYYDEKKNNTNVSYFFYFIKNNSLFEILTEKPRVINDSWDDRLAIWFLTDDLNKGILVNEEVPDILGYGNESITLVSMSPRQDNLKFRVESDNSVPVLIKISAFPNWKAYQEGKPLKIYMASPYMMLIYGYGEIELRYESIWIDKLGNLLSLLGLLILFFLMFFNKIKNNK